MKKHYFLFSILICAMQLTYAGISFPVTPNFALASNFDASYPLTKAADGLTNTFFYSKTTQALPDTLDFYFKDVRRIDSLVYIPFTSANGRLGIASVYYAKAINPDKFIQLNDVNFGMSSTPIKLALNGANGIFNPVIVRIIVKTAQNNVAACAEMQFRSKENIPVSKITQLPTQNSFEKIPIQSATASSVEAGYEIEKSFDNNVDTYYNSKFGVNPFPLTLEYTLSNTDRVDFLEYTPRKGTLPTGNFKMAEIWYSTKANPTSFTKLMDYDFALPRAAVKVQFPTLVFNPAVIRLILLGGHNDRATCAEMAFYKAENSNPVFANIFKDEIFSGLKPGVMQADIDNLPNGYYKELAQCQLDEAYDTLYRVQSFEPYPVRSTTAKALKLSTYSPYENPTGIYFSKGAAIIFVEDTWNQDISLLIRLYSTTENKNTNTRYKLQNGLNIINVDQNGLGYIEYFTDNYKNLKPVKMHFVNGELNRYFDIKKNTDAHWVYMYTNGVTEMFDLQGQHTGMHFPIDDLKRYNPRQIIPLINRFDTIIGMQFEEMGLYKYNRVPKNNMYSQGDDIAPFAWNASGDGVTLSTGMDVILDINSTNFRSVWGIAHEYGHVNQVRPGIKWAGTAEVTNNIYSCLSLYKIRPLLSRLETENKNDAYWNASQTNAGLGLGNSMIGGRYNSFLRSAILNKDVWLFQYGADDIQKIGEEEKWFVSGGDFFVRVVPLWQLTMYCHFIQPEKKEWLADISEIVRNTDETGLTNGQLQLKFLKNVCDVTKTDFSDFFATVGMLRTFDRTIDDYGFKNIAITEQDSTETVNYIKSKGYPKPSTPVLHYLSKFSIDAYKNKLDVVGGNVGEGCSYSFVSNEYGGYKNYVTVNHNVWKNVAVFETYKGSTLSDISMVSSGYIDNSKTRVYYPTGATAIYAVAYDGKRTLVYGTATSTKSVYSNNLSIEPNITKDSFKINGLTEKANLKIIDLMGRILIDKQISSHEIIQVNRLQTGNYIVTITSKNGTESMKLIVTK